MTKYPDRENSRIILIGVSDYERHGVLPRLPAVHNNLTALEAILTDPTHGVFLHDHCSVVDSPDSPRSLMSRLTRGANEAQDVLFVYYAGHGMLDSAGDLYLTVRETDPDLLSGTAVPYEWIRQVVSDSPATTRILILDCCFSGRAVGIMSSDSAALSQIEVRGTYILASTTANRVSISVPGEKFTAFTGELINLFSAVHKTPLLLVDLYGPLSAAMSRRGLPRPKCNVGDTSGQLALLRPLKPRHERPSEVFGGLYRQSSSDTAANAEDFRARWSDVLEVVKETRKVSWILLSHATIYSCDAETLILDFEREGDAKGFVNNGCGSDVRKALRKIYGISPRVCTVSVAGIIYREAPVKVEMIRAKWEDILEIVKETRKVAWILLSNAKISDFDGEMLTLDFEREGDAKGFASAGCGADLRKALEVIFGISPRMIAIYPDNKHVYVR